MKPMVWHPEEKDEKTNQYLDNINHAPYQTIVAILAGSFLLFTMFILFGTF